MARKIPFVFLLAVSLAGCMGQGRENGTSGGDRTAGGDGQEAAAVPADLSVFNAFSFNFAVGILSGADENLAVSPLSCGFALGMLNAGASGAAAESLGAVFAQPPAEKGSVNAALKKASDYLTALDKQVELTTANSLWYSDKVTVKPDFRKTLEKYYGAGILALDFADPGSVGIINGWVEKQTKSRIKNLVDSIEPDHRAILINALYFKGAWTESFDEALTRPGDFYPDGGGVIETPFMHAADMPYLYAETEQARILSLAYGSRDNKKGSLVFTLMLPREGMTTERLMADLTLEEFRGQLASRATVTYKLYLPKFRMESEVQLNTPLAESGLGIIFGSGADFSGMLDSREPLAVDYIKQKCFVDVSEKGTEAAAATSAAMKVTSVSKDPVIVVNRPFVFFIQEETTGLILFAGVIKKPQYNK